MDILVCISKTPDTTSRVSFKSGDTEYNSDGISFILNPYDEWYALVRALEIAESHNGKVTVIHAGDQSSDIVIRKALAIGAEEAVRIDINPKDPYETAFQIAAQVTSGDYKFILTGKETIDYNGAVMGSILAEMLDIPFLSNITRLDVTGPDTYEITREIEGGEEVCSLTGFFVASAAKGLAEQRIPNMKGIMMSKSKPLHVVPAAPFQPVVSVEKFTLPEAKKGVTMISPEQMDELVRLLHEEAKVL